MKDIRNHILYVLSKLIPDFSKKVLGLGLGLGLGLVLVLVSIQIVQSKFSVGAVVLNSAYNIAHTVLRVCHGSSPPGLYPSIRVRTAPPVSVRVRVRVSVSFSFSVTLLRILFCMCPKDT